MTALAGAHSRQSGLQSCRLARNGAASICTGCSTFAAGVLRTPLIPWRAPPPMTSRLLPRITSAVHGKLIFGRRVQALAENIVEMIPDGVSTLLDVGCGDGTLARSLMERRPGLEATGVEISDYQAGARQVAVSVKPTAFSKYRVQFIGKGGRLLKEVGEPSATYDIRGDEGYVRARVRESNGRMAWCQPVAVPGRFQSSDC